MQHGDVWRALDTIATRKGLTPSGLAKLAGLDATAFNKSKRISKGGRPRWPSTESIARALNAASIDYTEFATLVSGPANLTIPFLEFRDALRSGLFSDQGVPDATVWDAIAYPGPDIGEGCFALEVTDRSLLPVYRMGDRLIASCLASIRLHDRVLVKTTDDQLCIGVIAQQTAHRLDLKSMVDEGVSTSIPVDEMDWMARIIWVSQ